MAEQISKIREEYTWSEFLISLYDKLTGVGAEISYEFENFEVYIPMTTADDTPYAKWRLNGILKIRSKELK